MLAKKNRLTSTLIDPVFKKGTKVTSGHFLFIYLKNEVEMDAAELARASQDFQGVQSSKTVQASRFAIAVSKKIAPHAVVRNKLRRAVYRVLQEHIEEVHPGFSVLIVTKKIFLELSHEELEQEILGLLKKSGLLNI